MKVVLIFAYPTGRLSFFKWTIKSEIAAGVTPGRREALARLSGLASDNFCLTSLDKPTTAS